MLSSPVKTELLMPSGVIKVNKTKALEHKSSSMELALLFGTGKLELIKSYSWLE